MATGIKPPRNNRRAVGASSLILPSLSSPASWERWRVSKGTLTAAGQVQLSQLSKKLKNSILALSTTDVFSVPLWLDETNESNFASLISLQLESRGFKFSGQNKAFDWAPVTMEGGKALILVGVLPNQLLPTLLAENFEWFDAAVRFRHYSEDSLTIWQEQGRLCLAFTRGNQLAHFQALTENVLNQSTIRDVACIYSGLQMQAVLKSIRSVVLWFKAEAEGIKLLETALGLTVTTSHPPKPSMPGKTWALQPAEVVETQKINHWLRWRDRYLKFIVIGYSLIFLFILGHLLWTYQQITTIKSWLEDNQPKLAQVHQTIATWRELSPLVDREGYPLETLLHCATSLPPAGTHLTMFGEVDGNVTLEAESRDAAQAYEFLDKLKQDRALSRYHWVSSQPVILPNGTTQFEIKGSRESSK